MSDTTGAKTISIGVLLANHRIIRGLESDLDAVKNSRNRWRFLALLMSALAFIDVMIQVLL